MGLEGLFAFMGSCPCLIAQGSVSIRAYSGCDPCVFMAKAWKGSTRAQRLPRDWWARRRRVLARDERRCYVCGGEATEVDHVIRGDDHDESNLRAICNWCHRQKSTREGSDAARLYDRPRNARPVEAHPGRVNGAR